MQMAKQHKIRRYYRNGNTFKARPHPITVILSLLGIGLLVFVGISIYTPVYNLIMGNYEPSRRPDPSQPDISAQEPVSQPQSEPDPDPGPVAVAIADLKAAYLPMDKAKDSAAREQFLAALPEGVDTVMVDLKDRQGNVLFDTKNESALSWGAVAAEPLSLSGLAADLERKGLKLAARMPAFCDQLAAAGDREIAILYQGTEYRWLDASADAGGKAWLNPYAAGAREYIADLAVEAVEAGAVLVMLEEVQFPAGSDSPNASFGVDTTANPRGKALADFVQETTARVESAGGRLAVYVSAVSLTQSDANQVRYGGSPLHMVGNTLALGLLPYQFAGGYDAEGLVIDSPYQFPSATVATALEYAQGQLALLEKHKDTVVIPLLQGGAEPAINNMQLDSFQLLSQIQAVEQAGCGGYILHQTAGDYAK